MLPLLLLVCIFLPIFLIVITLTFLFPPLGIILLLSFIVMTIFLAFFVFFYKFFWFLVWTVMYAACLPYNVYMVVGGGRKREAGQKEKERVRRRNSWEREEGRRHARRVSRGEWAERVYKG
ncbi:hypothetical protein WAI453_000386 [Rhynchosporium graminicola]|uniref:Uncharacterized protein n=1 Tax=Rhynchosporium graminicola TaxID=2792576 RepID=A0A1E1JQ98_9HELO|nr:uncharacterized protein RCO7_00964 [Rhynchosporium commune]